MAESGMPSCAARRSSSPSTVLPMHRRVASKTTAAPGPIRSCTRTEVACCASNARITSSVMWEYRWLSMLVSCCWDILPPALPSVRHLSICDTRSPTT